MKIVLVILITMSSMVIADTIQDKYAQSLTREIRKDEQIKFLQKENNENGFWKFVNGTVATVFCVLWISK